MLKSATVFLNNAELNAELNAKIPTGVSKLVIEDLAAYIDPNSIKIGGTGDFTLLAVNFEQNFINKKKKALLDSINSTQEEIEMVKMMIDVAENEKKMVMANAEIKSETDGLIPEDFKEMIDFFRTKLTEIGTRKLQLGLRLSELTALKNRQEQQLNTDPSRNLPVGNIILTLSAASPTNVNLSLSYLVPNAGWTPIYDIRVKDTNASVELAYKANVYQNTGLDWENVKLSLSTLNPNANGTKPELNPQYLGFFVPQVLQYESRVMAKSAKMEAEAPEMLEEMATAADFVNISESTLAVTYTIDLPYTIKSGANAEVVEVAEYLLPAAYKYYLVPKKDKNAFLVAQLKNWEKYNLLPGASNIYFEGTYVGKSYINTQNTNDLLLVSLGVDKKVVSERKEITDYKSRKNIGSNIRESFGYTIEVRNTKSELIDLIIEDQIPVSQDSDITVTADELSAAIVEPLSGKLTWNLSIPAAQNRTLALKYEVKYPKDKTITGL